MGALAGLHWDGYAWSGAVNFDDPRVAQRSVLFDFLIDGEAPNEDDPCLEDAESAWLEHVVTTVPTIAAAAMDGIFRAYPELRRLYLDSEDASAAMPDLDRVEDLFPLVDLRSITVYAPRSDPPYVGLTYGCAWDGEHGLGVTLHGVQVVDVGTGDVVAMFIRPDEG